MTTQARELAGIITNAGDLLFDDDVTLKSDGAVLNFGADSDVTLTHVADTALLLNSTRRLQFGDSGTYINQSADSVLNITSDTEVEINATIVDINANVDISGTLTVAGALDFGDLDISNVGSIALDTITNDGTDITLDSSGDIVLDADGGDIFFKDAGTTFGSATNTSGNLIIKSGTTTALTFSGANATVAGTVTSTGLTVNGATVFNENSADVDFRVESDDKTHMFFVDASTDSIGIGTSSINLTAADRTTVEIDGTTSALLSLAVNGTSKFYNYTDANGTNLLHSSGYLRFSTAGANERMRILADGKVGIGVTAPATTLANTATRIANADGLSTHLSCVSWEVNGQGYIAALSNLATGGGNHNCGLLVELGSTDATDKILDLESGGVNRVRVLGSGVLLVGKTSSGVVNVGAEFRNGSANYAVTGTSDGATAALFSRKTSEGEIVQFRQDNVAVGAISTWDGEIAIGRINCALIFDDDVNKIKPHSVATNTVRDNALDLGDTEARFDDIYATNGTIQTSDRNEKQDIEELNEAEQRVAISAKGLLRKFRWKDKVLSKGDKARTHFGIIAQDLQVAFEAEGLDAGDYAMFISSTWWEAERVVPALEAIEEVLDDDGNVVTEAVEAVDEHTVIDSFDTLEKAPEDAVERTRMGVRYSELLAFIISAL